jgi:hypothetical protein
MIKMKIISGSMQIEWYVCIVIMIKSIKSFQIIVDSVTRIIEVLLVSDKFIGIVVFKFDAYCSLVV